MTGSENGYAGALFLALISLGAVLKIDDIMIGGAVGAVGALLAAISLRHALNQSAQAAEEDHQRMEVQFQQLRTKVIESSSASITASESLNEVTRLLQENLKLMNDRQTELDNLTQIAKNVESINLALAGLEENSFAVNTELEKIFVAIQSQEKSPAAEDFKKLIEIEETNKENLLTGLKILHAVAQMMRNSSYTQELEKINSTLENLGILGDNFSKNFVAAFENLNAKGDALDELKISGEVANKNLSELVKISGSLSRSFTTTLDDLRHDVARLSAKLEELNNLINKNNSAVFSEEDLNLLKKIAAKLDLK